MTLTADIVAELKQFLMQELHVREDALDPDTNLIETGVLDSISFIAMVSFMEKRVGRWVPDEELVSENFVSLRTMSNLIARIDALARQPSGAP